MTIHRYFGGVEGGGTKFVCMIASSPEDIVEEKRFATTTHGETIDRMIDFFRHLSNPDIYLPLVLLRLARLIYDKIHRLTDRSLPHQNQVGLTPI